MCYGFGQWKPLVLGYFYFHHPGKFCYLSQSNMYVLYLANNKFKKKEYFYTPELYIDAEKPILVIKDTLQVSYQHLELTTLYFPHKAGI